MYFGTKSYLKSNRNHITKQAELISFQANCPKCENMKLMVEEKYDYEMKKIKLVISFLTFLYKMHQI